ncbi:MAG: transcription termination factor Rho [Puniceicoccales bacterium]|jgi:transcription termination factor Rho|nr:transcription termination factor Rho [Puniceicoccales bacterium]
MDRTGTAEIPVEGLFDLDRHSGQGRLLAAGCVGRWDRYLAHVPQSLLRQLRLRTGQGIVGRAVPAVGAGQLPRLVRVDSVDGLSPRQRCACVPFFQATSTAPRRFLRLETEGRLLTTRLIDLFAPIGRGQRGLIVAPPRSGKTILLRAIANGIRANAEDCHLLVLLVDERPEEVTDFQRNVPAELFASSNDEPVSHHLQTAQLAFERAQNLVEAGRDVVLLLDSITRLARAHNNGIVGHSGRTMSGGLDSQAMEKPRQLFAMARETEEIGSLTVLATALVETGSRMDELIFQEFKGTGNWEVVLDRRAAEQRLFPAVNLQATGTRREELLLAPAALEAAQRMRRALAGQRPEAALETLLSRLGKTVNNGEFVALVGGRG